MKKIFFLIITVLVISSIGGCQDEVVYENKSPGEKIGEQIMELAKKNNTNLMRFANELPDYTIYRFEINRETIAVHKGDRIEYYNLNYVQHFSLEHGPSGYFISVWFINPYDNERRS
jgi:hypothetical protein